MKWRSRTPFTFLALLTASMTVYGADADKDGIDDLKDNCVHVANKTQLDTDGDGVGNFCDGDLNQDGVVDATDQRLASLAASDESLRLDADLNGDGLVNATDSTLMRGLLGRPPGTSATALANQPPRVLAFDLAQLDVPSNTGENGALFVRFDKGEGSAMARKTRLVISVHGQRVELLDTGKGMDQVPDDGVFSGLTKVDFDGMEKDQAQLEKWQLTGDKEPVAQFDGRTLVSQQFEDAAVPSVFDSQAAAGLMANPGPVPLLKLPAGLTLRPFPGLSRRLIPAFTNASGSTLMITDRRVVADPTRTFDPCDTDRDGNLGNVNGAWSFKTLMANMTPTATPATPPTPAEVQKFIFNWLRQWMVPTIPPGGTVAIPARPGVRAFFPGWDGTSAATLNINNLPFRLVAIVNRMDLGSSSPYGGSSPGETRLVFGLCRRPNQGNEWTKQTQIFEFGDTNGSCSGQRTRAQQWRALRNTALISGLGSPAYNAQLQALTDTVTTRNAAPGRVNGSALNHLRTNDFAYSQNRWEQRDAILAPGATGLQPALLGRSPLTPAPQATLANDAALRTPKKTLNMTAALDPLLASPGSLLPAGFPAEAVQYLASDFWSWSPLVNPAWLAGFSSQRHEFSLASCDSCHARESNTSFTHIDPNTLPATLSGFLAGVPGATPTNLPFPVTDPVIPAITRNFNDLQRRGQVLAQIAVQSCNQIAVIPDQRPIRPPVPSPALPVFSH